MIQLLIALLLLPGYLIFDILPKTFGFKGFSNWINLKNKINGDKYVFIIYLSIFLLLTCFLLLSLYHEKF